MLKKLLRDYGIRGSLQLLVAVGNFAVIQVAGRVLPVQEFGRYALVLAANGLALLVFYQPLTEGLNRFVSDARRTDRQLELQRTVARLAIASTAAMLVVYGAIIGGALLFDVLPRQATLRLLIIAPAFFIFYSCGTIIAIYFNASARYRAYLFCGVSIPYFSALAVFAASKIGNANATAVIIAQTTAILTILVSVATARFPNVKRLVYRLGRVASKEEKKQEAAFLRFIVSIPFLSLASYISMYGDRIAVAHYFTLRDVGEYSYMYVLTMNVALAAFNVYSASTFLRSTEELSHAKGHAERRQVILKFFRISAAFPLCFTPLLPLYWFYDQSIVHIVFGETARVPEGCLPLVLMAAAFFGGGMQLSLVANLVKRQHELIWARWIIILLFISAISTYHTSLKAICVDLLVVNISFFALISLLVWRKVPPLLLPADLKGLL